MTAHAVAPDRDLGLQGHYAGMVTRFGAFVIDIATAATLFAIGAGVFEYIVSALIGSEFKLRDAPVGAIAALGTWWFLYCAYPLAVGGRTFGMAALGLRVVRVDGSDLDVGRAVLRVLVFPLSFLLMGLGFVLILLRRDRRALHDLIVRSAVVYAWDARAARLRFLARSVPVAMAFMVSAALASADARVTVPNEKLAPPHPGAAVTMLQLVDQDDDETRRSEGGDGSQRAPELVVM
jgi:uncharacterized RDD family membrane protein YckC